MRMNELFESDEWFGGKNVLFVGDILQLPPVRGQPMFDKVTASTLKYRLGSMGAVNIWRDTHLQRIDNNRKTKNRPEIFGNVGQSETWLSRQ